MNAKHPLQPLVHGTNYGYLSHGCRCPECKAAHAAYSRRRYAEQVARDVEAGLACPYVPRVDVDAGRCDVVYGAATKATAPQASWWLVEDRHFAAAWQQQVPRWLGGLTPWLP